uniref:VM domain-containing protein n=1 Tax=Parastrongyloides trichosuri TaxID=131310 RepID=A0A0N4ZPX9_PARTI
MLFKSLFFFTTFATSFGQNFYGQTYIPRGPGPVLGQNPIGGSTVPSSSPIGGGVVPGSGYPQTGPGESTPIGQGAIPIGYPKPGYPYGNPCGTPPCPQPTSVPIPEPVSCPMPPCPSPISIKVSVCSFPPCPQPAPVPIPEPVSVPIPEPAPVPVCALPPCPAPVPVPACALPPCPQLYRPLPVLQPSPIYEPAPYPAIPQFSCALPPCSEYEQLIAPSYRYTFPRYTAFSSGLYGYGSKKNLSLNKRMNEEEKEKSN